MEKVHLFLLFFPLARDPLGIKSTRPEVSRSKTCRRMKIHSGKYNFQFYSLKALFWLSQKCTLEPISSFGCHSTYMNRFEFLAATVCSIVLPQTYLRPMVFVVRTRTQTNRGKIATSQREKAKQKASGCYLCFASGPLITSSLPQPQEEENIYNILKRLSSPAGQYR